MPKLMVNIDHVATLREARGIYYPEPVYAAGIVEMAGASGIIVHLREDRRHIKDRDVKLLREVVRTKLNLEMAATDEMVGIAREIKPEMATLVPEKRQELTTEGGLDVLLLKGRVAEAVGRLRESGIKVSLFIDPVDAQIVASSQTGAEMVDSISATLGRNVVDHPRVNQTAPFFLTPISRIWMASFGFNHKADNHEFSS